MFCAEDRIDKGFFSYEPGSQCGMIHNDHLATPQKMTDNSGTVVWAADFKPFGEATVTVLTITNNLRFPGQYYDAETMLNYNYFRDYNPAIGKYLEADPIGLRGGINLYRHVENNPVNWSDPLGLQVAGTITPAGPAPFPIIVIPKTTPQQQQQAIDIMKKLMTPWPLILWDNIIKRNSLPPGFWPADRGAEEWGRKHNVDPKEARRRFHKGVKQGCGDSKATDKFGVNPDTAMLLIPKVK